MKLAAMIEAIERYSNENLNLAINTNQPYIAYYESNQESQSDTEEEEEPKCLQEALMQLKSVKHPDDIVGVDDWEKIIKY